MSHEISNVNGRDEMAYVGEVPWHGLGAKLQPGAPLEEWLRCAMPFRVNRSKVRYAVDRQGTLVTSDEDIVLFRSDNHAKLGIVSDKYNVVQPAQVLEFFRDLVGQYGFQLETAGTLKGGRIVWALAKVNGAVLVGKHDPVRGYVLVSTSFDGSRRTEAAHVATRVVCANTLRMSDGETTERVRTSHRSVWDADAVKAKLGIARQTFEEFMVNARVLAGRKVSDADVAGFMSRVLADKALKDLSAAEGAELESRRIFKAVMKKFMGEGKGADLDSARGTAWGLVNAVTEYVDHDAAARSQDNRLYSAWMGNGDALKSKALATALAMV